MTQSKMKLIIFSITLVLIFILTCIFAAPAHGTPIDEIQAEQQQILNEIEQYQIQLDELSDEYNAALIKADEAKNEIKRLTKEIKTTEEKIAAGQQQLKMQAVNVYKHGDISYIEVLLNAQSFESFVTNIKYSNSIVNQTNDLIIEQQELKTKLQEDKKKQEQAKKEAEDAATAAQQAMDEANTVIVELENRYSQLDAEVATLLYEQETYGGYIPQYYDENGESTEYTYTYNGDSNVVARAYSKIGCPYSWGGTTSSGFDCSGFVSYCLSGQEGTRLGTSSSFST